MKRKGIVLLIICILLATEYFLKSEYYESKKEKEQIDSVKTNKDTPEVKNGDIIFHTSQSAQSEAIQLATNSKYSHCGIIFMQNDQPYVFEAAQSVKLTPLNQWIARGKGNKYVIKRLIDANHILTKEALAKMQGIGESFLGKNYDLTFEWSDEKLYCSELIWKIYQRGADIELGKLEKLEDFDLSNIKVQTKLQERYGTNIPLNETVISPQAIFDSSLLMTIQEE